MATLETLPGVPAGQINYSDYLTARAKAAANDVTTAATTAATTATVATYAGDNGERLLNITQIDAEKDDERLAYLKLIADDGAFLKDFPKDMVEDQAIMESLLTEIKSKYQKFIVTAMGVSSQEKTQIMSTFGDAFAATFTGREPTVLSVTGNLIFDYGGKSSLSWYTAFLNAYDYYLRGSRLAKWRAKMKLILPDLAEYTGYMLSLSTQFSADTDGIVAMQFSYLVTGQTIFKSTVEPSKKAETKTTKDTLTLPSTVVPNADAASPYEIQKALNNPDLEAIVGDFSGTTYDIRGKAYKVSSALSDEVVSAATDMVNRTTTLTTGAIGSYLDPKDVILQEQMKSYTDSLKSVLQNNTNNVTTAATGLLKTSAQAYVKSQVEAGVPMTGAVIVKLQKNVAGLMGNVASVPTALTTLVDGSAIATSLKWSAYGSRSKNA